jgi:Secretion system C-terminal sorting domain
MKMAMLVLSCGMALAANGQQVMTVQSAQMTAGPGSQIVVRGGITFTGTASLNHNGVLRLQRNSTSGVSNWLDSTAGGVLSGTGQVLFESNTTQQQFYGNTNFYDFTINNGAGLLLNSDLRVSNTASFEQGLVTTGSNVFIVSNPALNAVQSSTSFTDTWVEGTLRRNINQSGVEYLFPIGKVKAGPGLLYAPVKINKFNTTAVNYEATYLPVTPPDRLNFINPPIDHISSLEYWQIKSISPPGPLDDDCLLSLSWRTYSVVSADAATRDSLLVAHYMNNAGFRWEPEFNILAANNVSGSVAFGYVTTNKPVGIFSVGEDLFTLGTRSPFNVLPVNLLEWNVALRNKEAVQSWKVENDAEVARYEVEHSAAGIGFSKIATVNSNRSSGIADYTSVHTAPLPGWNFYRLKIIDRNGRGSYTDVRRVWLPRTGEMNVYPNPAQNFVIVSLPDMPRPGDVVRIVDMRGVVLKQVTAMGQQVRLDLSALARGNYVVQVLSGGQLSTVGIVKE